MKWAAVVSKFSCIFFCTHFYTFFITVATCFIITCLNISHASEACDHHFSDWKGPSKISHNVQRAQQGKPLCDFIQLCLESLWDLPGKSVKIKHPGTFLGNNPLLSLEHWPLWLAWARWPCPIPFHQHSGQCEQKTGTLIRDAQMGRSWWQTVSCPSSSMRPLCLSHTQWGYTLQEGVNTDSVRQTKTSFVLRCFSDFFLAAYLFNFLRGRRGLPYLRLFIPANRLVAFCLQVTHPEVTFNSWTKKMCGHALWHSLSAWGDY